ncbi:uncharacterized protein LOC139912103 [Centroberyx gerrardi]|uniref:uncharacterized protein n=1 Tax=Centroberyx gerrardi TaxID=166262 RepID=UPI003AAC1D43
MKPCRHSAKPAVGLSKQPHGRLAPISPQRMSAPQTDVDNSERKLQRENTKLRQELEELRCQYRQLVNEGPEEKYEERRLNLLKAQLMQLERQVVLLSEGLSSHVCRCLDVEKALNSLTHTLRSLVGFDSSQTQVTVPLSELTRLIEMCSTVSRALHRNNKVNTVQGLTMPWVLSPPSLQKQPMTLLDVCYGRTDGINLQYVSSLESGLSQLFKHLLGLKYSLTQIVGHSSAPSPGPAPGPDPDPVKAPQVVYERLLAQTSISLSALELCCTDLLPLSLIGPHSPQGRTELDVCVEMKVADVLSLLPALSRGAQQRATRAAQAIVHTHNHAQRMARLQLEAAEAELQFHGRMSSLQAGQTQQLIQGLGHAYRDFQNNIQHSLCEPMQDILSCYDLLVASGSDEALKGFLSAFETNQSELRETVGALATSQEQGEVALAQCEQDFQLAADRLRREWEEQKDSVAVELEDLKVAYNSALLQLDTLRRERRHTYTSDAQASNHDVSHTPHTHPNYDDNQTTAPLSCPSVKGDAGSPASTNQITPEHHGTPRAALSNQSSTLSSVVSDFSRLSVSQQPRVSQRPTNQRARSKVLPRPPWQS